MTVIRKALALLCLAVLLFTAITTDLAPLIVVTVEQAVPIASEVLDCEAELSHRAVPVLALALLRAPPLSFSLS